MKSRALVFDLYGEYFRYRGGEARLGTLTRVMGVFDVAPAAVRTVMTRLRREGWFDSSKAGREVTYALNDKSWRMLDNGRARIFDRPAEEWDRTWTQALVDSSGLAPEARRRIQTTLNWWGFGSYGRGPAWFSPHDREKKVREMLAGPDDLHVQFLRCRSGGLPADRLIAERCWELADLALDYQRFIEDFQHRLPGYRHGIGGRGALVEQIRLIQTYRRYPFRDPDLPDLLLPAGWRGRTAHEVFVDCHRALDASSQSFLDEIAADM